MRYSKLSCLLKPSWANKVRCKNIVNKYRGCVIHIKGCCLWVLWGLNISSRLLLQDGKPLRDGRVLVSLWVPNIKFEVLAGKKGRDEKGVQIVWASRPCEHTSLVSLSSYILIDKSPQFFSPLALPLPESEPASDNLSSIAVSETLLESLVIGRSPSFRLKLSSDLGESWSLVLGLSGPRPS